MDRIVNLRKSERAGLIREASRIKKLTPEVIEKDLWVCWTLDRLFGDPEMARKILFKGGTSLSKVFGLIERFSEDVDLVLDWREVTSEDPTGQRSNTKQDAFNKDLLARTQLYLRESFVSEVRSLVEPVCQATIEDNPEVVLIRYPAAFPSDYLKPEIQLEVGPLAAWSPNDHYVVRPYAAEALPKVFQRPELSVIAIKAERTFWEKLTILHHEAHRPEGNPQPPGYSRHYYDVFRMAQSDVKQTAFADLGLLRAVVEFKQKFYRRGWARYGLATPGTMRLLPSAHVMKDLERDYERMQFMIFGERPTLVQIMDSLHALEEELRAL